MNWNRWLLIIGLFCLFVGNANAEPAPEELVQATLDALHQSAAEADGKKYFSLFSSDAIFIGTDASERWSIEAFKQYGMPYFDQGKGWRYHATERHLHFDETQTVAWFDELLWNEKYGVCRGTGVLKKTTAGWKIAQYHLTIPLPNPLAEEITQRIKQLPAPTVLSAEE